MRLLVLDTVVWKHLRAKYYIALVVLPLALMCGSSVPIWFFAEASAGALGILPNVPVKEQPNGFLWFFIFLTVGVILIVVCYVLGFLLNALIMRWAFGWSWEQLRELFLFSRVPRHWLRNDSQLSR